MKLNRSAAEELYDPKNIHWFDSPEEANNYLMHCGYPARLVKRKDKYGYNWGVAETQASLKSRWTPKYADPKRKRRKTGLKAHKKYLEELEAEYQRLGRKFENGTIADYEKDRMYILSDKIKSKRQELKGYDPAPKRKTSAWIQFVIAHKHMRTKKGLIDLRAISKLWKLKKGVKTKR